MLLLFPLSGIGTAKQEKRLTLAYFASFPYINAEYSVSFFRQANKE